MPIRARRHGLAAVLACLSLLVLPAAGGAATVTVAPDTPGVGNCYPFGGVGAREDAWGPNLAFVYKDVPAFELQAGDELAFDLGNENDTDVQLAIALAPTTTNGGDQVTAPFTPVVPNTATPANPRGNTTVGDFELGFTVTAPFSFPGGGLAIRFSDPAGAFATDHSCDQVLVHGSAGDASGHFVGRHWKDPDGTSPWVVNMGDGASVGAFRVTTAFDPDTTPPGTFSLLSPAAGARTTDTTPTLSWGTATGATEYEVLVDGRPVRTLAGTALTTGRLSLGAHLWQVRARDAAGNVRRSASRTFTVVAPPRPPAPPRPADEDTIVVRTSEEPAVADADGVFDPGLTVRCPQSRQGCTGSIRATTRVRTRRGRRATKLAATRAMVVRAGEEEAVRLRLNRTGRRLLARDGTLTLRISVVVRSPRGLRQTRVYALTVSRPG